MKFTLEIKMDTDAFCSYPGEELSRILRKLAEEFLPFPVDDFEKTIQDVDGNTVGRCEID